MKTGLSKKQKVTEVYYNAKDTIAEVYTHDTKLKRRLRACGPAKISGVATPELLAICALLSK